MIHAPAPAPVSYISPPAPAPVSSYQTEVADITGLIKQIHQLEAEVESDIETDIKAIQDEPNKVRKIKTARVKRTNGRKTRWSKSTAATAATSTALPPAPAPAPASSSATPASVGTVASIKGNFESDFLTEVTVGAQTFQAVVDTGSATFAIAGPGSGCTTTYNSQATCSGTAFQNYGSGGWSGEACKSSTIDMNGLSAGRDVPFGLMTKQQSILHGCAGEDASSDGLENTAIMGIAYKSLNSVT
jgi:hypothetical protein